jgi:hypothetical protein
MTSTFVAFVALAMLAALAAGMTPWLRPKPAIAAPDPYNSVAYIIVDTALADGRDTVELEVMVYDPSAGPVTTSTIYAASSRKEDRVSITRSDGGYLGITITSSSPGISQIAISLASQNAASRYLLGQISYDDAMIIQTSQGQDIFNVYFISGALDIESCEMEFDKDTIARTDSRYSDNAIGTIRLRTEIDKPVANQRVTVYSDFDGILLYPSRTSTSNFGSGSSITLTTDRDGEATFVVRSYTLGDAEIICNVDGQEFSESVFIDLAENVFDLEQPEYDDDDEDEDEEPPPVISLEHTRVTMSKPIGFEYGSNARFNISTSEDGWDKIVLGGVAMSADGEPIRERRLVHAYVTAGKLDKTTTLTTSNGGAFSFSISSKDVCMGRFAVGLGTEEQLRGYLEGRVSAAACQLLQAGVYYFIGRDWDKYMLCAIGERGALINGHPYELDVAPFIQDDRTMLTARPIADMVSAISNWDPARQTASFYLTSRNYTLSMQIGSTLINRTEQFVAPRQYSSDVPALIRDGRTVLPLRAIAESFEMRTLYDADQRMVAVYNVNQNYRYNPRKDPNRAEYDPVVDPESEFYNERKDPDSPYYVPEMDPMNPRYDATRDPDSPSYDARKDPNSPFYGT